jgi:hypothetical protein
MGLIIKQNTRNIDEMCALCGGQVVPNVPIVLCRDNDRKMVCTNCGEKESSELAYLVRHLLSKIKYQTKEQLLAHYKERNPTQFIQFDGFDDLQPDDVMTVDEDGHSFFSRKTWELMHGSTVRLLVKPAASKETVLSLLHKIIKWIDRDFESYSQQELKIAGNSDNRGIPF